MIATCAENGLLRELRPGLFEIVDWQDFHSSRRDVEDQRTRATERKRQQRGRQMQLDVPTDVTPGHSNGVTGGQQRPSRAHARASTASASDTSNPRPPFSDKTQNQAEAFIRNGGYELTDLSLELELDQRGIPEDERHPLRDLAHDLRRPGAA